MLAKKFYLSVMLVSLCASLVVGFSSVSAKTILSDLPQADWTKYGINPWSLDTDNDGFSDAEEIAQKYCPTSAGSIAIADKNCKRGRFNLRTGLYTPPLGANFYQPRALKNFRSCSELTKTLQAAQPPVYYYRGGGLTPDSFGISQPVAAGFNAGAPLTAVKDFSRTNIQVEGVDEGDIVKTNGKHIFYLANNHLIVTSADPAVAEVVADIPLASVLQAKELYLTGSKLIMIGHTFAKIGPFMEGAAQSKMSSIYPRYQETRQVATILDVSNPANPTIERSVELTGDVVATRLTNGYVYLVLRSSLPYFYGENAKITAATALPQVRDITNEKMIVDVMGARAAQPFVPLAGCTQVQYLSPTPGKEFVLVVAIPTTNPKAPLGKKVMWGLSSNDTVYVSPSNIYITSQNYGTGSIWFRRPSERSDIYKFAINKNAISFVASQTIPGTVLNQFSMDEYSGFFRVVTTENANSGRSGFVNHLFILNDQLQTVSSIKNFAPTEKIYSARFMGNRAYVVTFRAIDPFIVFDLSNARSPQYIGELKIPGYSTYLHPYDDNHVIGFGQNTGSDAEHPGFVWTEGLKIGLFDVTNPNIPTLLFSKNIGDRGSISTALYDHHAFLFSREKNLLAIPAVVVTLSDEQKQSTSTQRWEEGRLSFAGLLAYSIDLRSGFTEIGRVTHQETAISSPEYNTNFESTMVKRSLYIGDNMYVVSDGQMTIHNLWNFSQLRKIKF